MSEMFERSLKAALVILITVSLVLLTFSLNGLVQTGRTSMICSGESPLVTEHTETLNGSTTLFSRVVIFNNATLPLNYLSGPVFIVYTGINKTPSTNYTISKSFPNMIFPGKSVTVYVNITVPFQSKITYFCQIDYYVGNWKPNPMQGDYPYVMYFSGVHFEWEG